MFFFSSIFEMATIDGDFNSTQTFLELNNKEQYTINKILLTKS